MIAGYVVAVLLMFRAVWAFFGPPYSRLASFTFTPRQIMAHFAGLLRRRPSHFIGHNPSGSAMILALFTVLTLLVATGFVVQGGVEKQGPLAAFIPYSLGMGVRSIHNLLAVLLLLMIGAHLVGVLAGELIFGERLIGAMIDGRKPGATAGPSMPSARPWTALAWLAPIALGSAAALTWLSQLPALGLPTIPTDRAMLTECGSCHAPFHPSLLPRVAWAKLMANLGDHFGEDASLAPAMQAEIAAYLERYAAESWDSKAAHRLATLDPANPLRITATPGWRRMHQRIDPAAFRSHQVGSPANCAACHRDAGSGRFDPQAIALPPGISW
jgi:cytochrome b